MSRILLVAIALALLAPPIAGFAATEPPASGAGTDAGIDLRATGMGVSPSSPVPGMLVDLYARVNVTGAPSASNFTIRFNLDGQLQEDVRVGTTNSAPGTYIVPWVALEGAHVLEILIDLHDELAEDNEGNNVARTHFDVVPRPDLELRDITWEPPEPVVGDLVVFTATVANVGLADGAGGVVKFQIRGRDLSSALPPVPAGGLAQVESPAWQATTGSLFNDVFNPSGVQQRITAVVWAPDDPVPDNNARTETVRLRHPGFVSLSATGKSEGVLSLSLAGDAVGVVALAPAGSSSGTVASLSVLGPSRAGGLAVSVLGDADASDPVPSLGAGSGIAVSGTGHAHGSLLSVSGCDALGACTS